MADVIQAQYVGLRTMANGCVRMTFDAPIEHMARIVSLFQKEGDPAAIARLADDVEAPAPKRKWEELSPAQQAGIRCEDPTFQQFAAHRAGRTSVDVADWVRGQCGVDSRSELNRNQDAADAWRMVEADYQSWLTTQRYAEVMR
jgi:hypothetical protein